MLSSRAVRHRSGGRAVLDGRLFRYQEGWLKVYGNRRGAAGILLVARSGQYRQASPSSIQGGKGGGSREIRDLKRRISEVIDAVLESSQDRGRAAVAIQGLNALRSVLELERKIRETEELEARIEALEQSQERGSRWGA
jgi:hypothetical protein